VAGACVGESVGLVSEVARLRRIAQVLQAGAADRGRSADSGETTIASFNEGLAYIGLGDIKAGEKLAEGAIAEAVAGDNLLDAQDLLREYANAPWSAPGI
jgi:hypothetical protein